VRLRSSTLPSEGSGENPKAQGRDWLRAARQGAAREAGRGRDYDCYNESEQTTGLYTMIEDDLALPFETSVLGIRVIVERIHLTRRDEIVAVYRRGGVRQKIPLLDLPLPSPPPAGTEWIEAYRHWLDPR